MEITVRLLPVGNTTKREIVALQTEVQDVMERMRLRVEPVHSEVPGGTKGIADEVGAFLVGLPSGVISGAFETIKSVLARPAQPPVKVKITAVGVDLEFDPQRISLKDMAHFIERMRPKRDAA